MRDPVDTKKLALAAAAALLLGTSVDPAVANKLSGMRGSSELRLNPIDLRRGPYGRRGFACPGGRRYSFRGGWGCDYYIYSWGYPKGRR